MRGYIIDHRPVISVMIACMENFEIPLKVIRHETYFFRQKHSKFGMEFQYKNRGFDLKKNFEIEPSLGMGINLDS